MISLLFKV